MNTQANQYMRQTNIGAITQYSWLARVLGAIVVPGTKILIDL